jgi:hypothetical protein
MSLMDKFNTYTSARNINNDLTIEKLEEAIKLLKSLPRIPFIIYSPFCPRDQMWKGKELDHMLEGAFQDFDSTKHEGFIYNPCWKDTIDKLLNQNHGVYNVING